MNGAVWFGLRTAVGLHPAAYRWERGDELEAVFADATEGAGPWATARELVDLAGHGVRLRLGLGSARLPAQLAAVVAPFALGAAVGGGLAPRVGDMAESLREGILGQVLSAEYTNPSNDFLAGQAGLVVLLLAAVAAGFRWWGAARLSALLGMVLVFFGELGVESQSSQPWSSMWVWQLTHDILLRYGPAALWVLVLLAAPRDLLGRWTLRRVSAALAGLLTGGFLLGTALGVGPVSRLNYATDSQLLAVALAGVELALVVLAVPAALKGRFGPTAGALAGAPIAVLAFLLGVGHVWRLGGHLTAVALIVVALSLAAAFWHWLPRLHDRRPPMAS
ncbi:hypothetical protein ACFYNO_16185 [Kitasatospora sp. NPDC006697]|uniref:hypothetical protein n=1 Tax=Kitasatospora sp. NPDC006697 TaxID=3364020 RepID=UPI0036954091